MDYCAIGYNPNGRIGAFTTGELEIVKSSARAFRRRDKYGMRVYPVVKVMTWEGWISESGDNNNG